MNLNLIAEILSLGRDLADAAVAPNVRQQAAAADILLKIIRKGVQAYQDHTGQALDPSLIKIEAPI